MSNKIVKEPLATDKTLMKLIQAIKDSSLVPECVDNLNSTSIDKPLSANQGRVLNNAITSLIKTVTLNLTTDAEGYAYYDFSSPVRVLSAFLSSADINVNGWMCGFAVRAGSPYLSYYFVVHGVDSSLFGSHQISVDVTYQDIQS